MCVVKGLWSIDIRVVTVQVSGRKVTVTGPRGTLTRDFGHTLVDITYFPKRHEITVDVWFGNKLEKSCIKSVCTHIKNMFTGVTKVYISLQLSFPAPSFPFTIIYFMPFVLPLVSHLLFCAHTYCFPFLCAYPSCVFFSRRVSHVQSHTHTQPQGFEYKMRFVYAHFPINVVLNADGTVVEVRNFLGEKINRTVVLPVGVKAVRSEKVKDEIVLSGNDVDDVSQSGM